MPPPASTTLNTFGQWSRPAVALIVGVRPNSARAMTRVAEKSIREQVSDPELQGVLLPDYPIGGKRILISDDLSPEAKTILERIPGAQVDFRTGLKPAELREIIGGYDALAVRSATKVTSDLLAAATRLRVIGRAGTGVPVRELGRLAARLKPLATIGCRSTFRADEPLRPATEQSRSGACLFERVLQRHAHIDGFQFIRWTENAPDLLHKSIRCVTG